MDSGAGSVDTGADSVDTGADSVVDSEAVLGVDFPMVVLGLR